METAIVVCLVAGIIALSILLLIVVTGGI